MDGEHEEPAAAAVDRDGAPAADDEVRDTLPEELDVTRYVGPYQFPDIARRRIPGALYLVSGAVMVGTWLLTRAGHPVLVNGGVAVGGVVLLVVGVYHVVTGWHVAVSDTDALAAASRDVGFPVGHASAQLGWQGLLSRPTWRILLYSAENPPTKRGLVLVDAIDGRVAGQLVQDNPEDWSAYDDV